MLSPSATRSSIVASLQKLCVDSPLGDVMILLFKLSTLKWPVDNSQS